MGRSPDTVDVGGLTLPLVGHLNSWQLVFLTIGSLGAPVLLIVLFMREPARTARKAHNDSGSATSAAHFSRHWRFYVCHIAGFSLLCMLMAAVSAWQPTHMQRTFDWDLRRVGAVLGFLHLVGGVVGMLGTGVLADRMQRQGRRDAHLRIYLFSVPVVLIATLATYWSGVLWLALVGIAVISVLAPFIAVAASALALATPPDRRGATSAVFLLVYNLLGFGTGPTAAAWLAGRLTSDGDVGIAIGAMSLAIAPIICVLFFAGLGPMRRAVRDVAEGAAPAAAQH